MNPNDGWVNFADYLSLNKDASQRQLQGVLDEQGANADTIRTNAQRQRAQAFSNGMDGEALNTNRDAQTGKLLMSYGNFVEGLSDPARLEAYFAKNGGGGNSALDAGLASVAGAGQIQEAQKGLSALRNYVGEASADSANRYQQGQQFGAQQKETDARNLMQRQASDRWQAGASGRINAHAAQVDDNWKKRGLSTTLDRFGGRFAGQGLGFNDPPQNGESEWQQAQRKAKENTQRADGLGSNAGW